MVKRLIHLSDIHIPKETERLEMFRSAFQNFFRIIDSFVSSDCMIVICGDLLHSKEHISPEQIMLARQFLEQCGKRCQTILIAGNHDMNMSSNTQLDSLTPCTSNIPNVVYLTESGVRIFDNIAFVVNSILLNVYNFELDTVDILKKQEFLSYNRVRDLLQGFTSVCLYHGIVDGAKCDNGFRLSSNVALDHLRGFDHVLLGDVHKHQYLDKHVAYSGSFVQQNHGEDIKGHGFILWDLETNTSAFHEVDNPFCFCTIHLERPLVDSIARLVGKSYIHLRMIAPGWSVQAEIDSDKKTIQAMIDSAGMQIVSIQHVAARESRRTALPGTAVTTEFSKDDQLDVLSRYAQQLGCGELLQELDQAITKKVAQRCVDTPHARPTNFNVVQLKFKNVYGFAESTSSDSAGFHTIDFLKCTKHSVVGIVGANFAGKSSILDIILFVLYEKTSRGKKADILRKGAQSFEIILTFSVSSGLYEVSKKGHLQAPLRQKGAASSSSVLDKITVTTRFRQLSGSPPTQIARQKETASSIKKVVCDYEDMVYTSFMFQNNVDGIICGTAAEKGKFFHRMLSLDYFEKKADEAEAMFRETGISIAHLQDKIRKTRASMQAHETYTTDQYLTSSTLSEIHEKIKILSEKKGTLMNHIVDHDSPQDLRTKHQLFITAYEKCKLEARELSDVDRDVDVDVEDPETLDSVSQTEASIEFCLEKKKTLLACKKELLAVDVFGSLSDISGPSLSEMKAEVARLDAGIDELVILMRDEDERKAEFERHMEEYQNLCVELTQWCSGSLRKKRKTVDAESDITADFDPECKYCRRNFDLDARDRCVERKDWLHGRLCQLAQQPEISDALQLEFSFSCHYLSMLAQLSEMQRSHCDISQKISAIQAFESEAPKREWNNKVDSVIEEVEHEIATLREEQEKKGTQLQQFRVSLRSFQKQEQQFLDTFAYESCCTEIEQLEAQMKRMNQVHSDQVKDSTRYEHFKATLRDYETELKELHGKRQLCSQYMEIFRKNLPAIVYREHMPDIESALRENCCKLGLPFQYDIVLDNETDQVHILLNGLSIDLCSGFEKLMTSLLMRIAIHTKHPFKSNAIFIDEAFSCLDTTHIQKIKSVFSLLVDHFENIYVVTHDPRIQQVFGSIIRVGDKEISFE